MQTHCVTVLRRIKSSEGRAESSGSHVSRPAPPTCVHLPCRPNAYANRSLCLLLNPVTQAPFFPPSQPFSRLRFVRSLLAISLLASKSPRSFKRSPPTNEHPISNYLDQSILSANDTTQQTLTRLHRTVPRMANHNHWSGVGPPRPYASYRGNYGFSPYPTHPAARGRGRGVPRGRVRGGVHHNRTLVNNNSSAAAVPPSDGTGDIDATEYAESPSSPATVSQTRTSQPSITSTPQSANRTSHPSNNQSAPQQTLLVNEVRFTISHDGKVLTKVTRMLPSLRSHEHASTNIIEAQESNAETPAVTRISGVNFYRSRNGNKYFRQDRRDEIALQKYSDLFSFPVTPSNAIVRATRPRKSTQLCAKFHSTGTCYPALSFAKILRNLFPMDRYSPPRRATNKCVGLCSNGPKCLFTHDHNKVAICKEFLQKGHCFRGAGCNLSHDPTPNRTPACIHFLRDACTKPDCRYAHVKIDPSADICRDYATIGYCEKGASCTERHENECPDYANTGSCPNKKCHLPHIDRAGQLRKIAGVQNIPSQQAVDKSSKSESDKEDDKDDVDSDDLEEDAPMLHSAGSPSAATDMNSFSQQQDFIHF
jgi:hypothetical protein